MADYARYHERLASLLGEIAVEEADGQALRSDGKARRLPIGPPESFL